MSSPFLVKGVPIATLPSRGQGDFNKVPKSPSGRPRDVQLPSILTRIPLGSKCARCRMRPCRCGGRR